MRAARDPSDAPRAIVLAATDPANPYGAALPWPARTAGEDETGRPQRVAGALVVLHDGALVGWLGRGGDSLTTFCRPTNRAPGASTAALANALAGLVESGERRALLLVTIDGGAAPKSALGTALYEAGFRASSEGWLRTRG